MEPVLVDDASSEVVCTGAWTHADPSSGYTAGDLFGTESFTKAAGATAELAFNGTRVGLYSARADNVGIIKISVDGKAAGTVDLYGPGKTPAQLVFRSEELAYGKHTITVECTGTKNAASKGTHALVDAFQVVNPVIDDASDRLVAEGEHTVTVRVTGRKNAAAADTHVVLDAFETITGDAFPDRAPGVGLIVSARVNYPDLAWGNYVDPAITLSAGWSATARLRLLP